MSVNLFCDDCKNVFSKLKDKSVDVSFTSPPYNRKRNDKYANYNDNINDYLSFLRYFTLELLRVSKKWVFINIQKNYYNKADVFKFIGEFSKNIVEIFIWNKSRIFQYRKIKN